MFNDALRLGVEVDGEILSLHQWQVDTNKDISYGRTRQNGEVVSVQKPTQRHPYKFALCAANGSGKDAFVIAPLALWFICTKIQAKVIITSASGAQLSTQTEHYISDMAKAVNKWSVTNLGQEIIKITKRHYYCILSGSVIHMFATDEGEKAEGHHPTAPGAEMMIIVNEAKSVKREIFDALRRCTGYNYWVNVSSPGEPMGEFYKSFQNWPNKRRVSYFDCPHQSEEEFEEDRRDLGENSALFRSKWLALFTFVGGRYVIPQDKLERLREANRNGAVPTIRQDLAIRVGLDIALSTNGDETVICFWRGNKQLDQKTFRIQDSTLLVLALELELQKWVTKDHKYIFADDGGVGRSVIDILNRKGYRINRVLNNARANNKRLYKNKGAQSWYKFLRLVEEQCLIFKDLNDERLFSQLASRKYKETDAGIDKMTLQSKKEAIAEGNPSPDRADANVLAFTDCDLGDFLDEGARAQVAMAETVVKKTPEELFQEIRQQLKHGAAESLKRGRVRGSQQLALSNRMPSFHR